MERTAWRPQGADNFRDLGCLTTTDGRRVRAGLVYRSDTLQELTATDVATLVDTVGLRLVIDLRLPAESLREGHGLLGYSSVRLVNLPLDVAGKEAGEPVPDLAHDQMAQHYFGYLAPSAASIVAVFDLLATAELPAVIHCAAGKDRTGAMSALILAAIGVPGAQIAEDYALSHESAPRVFARLRRLPSYGKRIDRLPDEVRGALPSTMLLFLSEIENRYTSVPALLEELGVTRDTLARVTARLVEG